MKALKYISLVSLVLQTTSMVVVVRYSRTIQTKDTERYLSSTAVVSGEIMKLIASMILIWYEASECDMKLKKKSFLKKFLSDFSLSKAIVNLYDEIYMKPLDTLKLAIPAALFTLQSNLLFIALSHLDAVTFQVTKFDYHIQLVQLFVIKVTYQLKILTTAFSSVILLGRQLELFKWISLFVLFIGVSLSQVYIKKIC